MELDSAIFKGIIPVMVYRKCLRHPNQPSHINGGDNVRMLDGSGERDSGSQSMALAVSATVARPKHTSPLCLLPLPLAGPRDFGGNHILSGPLLLFVAEAVAPAADEVVAIRRPPNQAAWKPCCSSCVCTAVRLHMTRSCAVAP